MASTPRQAQQPRSTVDIVVSILLLVLLAGFGIIGAAMGFMMLAFTDHCPVETCSIEGAVAAMLTAFAVAVVVAVTGSVVTVVKLVRRRPAWPWSLLSLVVCGAVGLAGFVGYLAAVGG